VQKANINGAELSYESNGSGEPVLLISPGPIRDGFLPLLAADAFRGRYQFIRYHQRRAHPANGDAPVSFAQHAADAAALIDHLGVPRAHVAGHSTGASIALQLAVDRPDLVHTLALLEPPLLAAPGADAFFETVGPAFNAYEEGDRAGAMTIYLAAACSLSWDDCRTAIEERVPGGVAQAIKDADNFFESYVPALNAWQFDADQAAVIGQPVLSVLGTDSERLFAESHKLLTSWFGQIETCVVEGVAHLLQLQRPQPVARCLAQFFAAHPMVERSAAEVEVAHGAER
jgi:pimeloyl-ACP methyl ester carboxylesterase